MFFQHIFDKSLAQNSYLVGCQATGEAIVIDPKRDVDTYLEIAKQNQLRITHVTETHIHADFLSGARELVALTGAELYLSAEGGSDWAYEFQHKGLKDNDVIKIGNLTFKVLHTPGHTPEHLSFLLTDHPASEVPVMLFTGDFVFVGDVGRPDLLEKAAGIANTKEEGAWQMHQSLNKFINLPDSIQIWPGHGAGSACGKALGAVPSSTVGYEKVRNWALQHQDNAQNFVDELLSDQPEPPKYFALMKQLNKKERPLLTQVPKHKQLSKEDFLEAYKKGIKIIDTRNRKFFEQGFLPGSINIQNNNSFSSWMGWMLSYEEPFVIVAKESDQEDITRKLMRIGLDYVYGYIEHVDDLGIPLKKAEIIDAESLKLYMQISDVQIIDIRSATEYCAGHITDAQHVFLGTLEDNLDKIARDKTVIIYCRSGDRASIGYSILNKHGFYNVKNYSAGMLDWFSNQEVSLIEKCVS